MIQWAYNLGNQDWFWFVVIPLVSVVLVILLNFLSKRNQDIIKWDDLIVGNDICIEGWGVNLGFLASNIALVRSDTVTVFLVVAIVQVLLFLCNAVFLRYGPDTPIVRISVSSILGLSALVLATFAWRA